MRIRSRSLRRYLRNTTPINQIEPPSNGPKNKTLINKRNRNNNNTPNNTPRHKDKKKININYSINFKFY